MIPKRIYEVVKIPLSANGKVNRNKLLNSIKQTDFDEKDEKQAEINMTNFEKVLLQCGKLYLKKIFWIRIQIFPKRRRLFKSYQTCKRFKGRVRYRA